MDASKLKEIIQLANDAVSGLDGDLKKIAFQTTLDKLLNQNFSPIQSPTLVTPETGQIKKVKKTRKSTIAATASIKKADDDAVVKDIVSRINRTKYQKMTSLESALDRSLYILLAVRDDLSIDGLSPTQIANLLRDVFRIKATKNAVSMALGKDTKYTDRNPVNVNGAKGYIYKIMHDGEEYIKAKLVEQK
jgi:hypothetical protein